MAYIDLTSFKARAGITTTTDDVFFATELDRFSNIIDKETNTVFSLTSATRKYYGRSNGVKYIAVGAWQETGLTVNQGRFGDSTLTQLTVDVDYRLIYPNRQNLQVIGIKMYNSYLSSNDYLQLSGSYGWSASLPSDLDMALFYSVLTSWAYKKGLIKSGLSGTGGFVSSEKSQSLRRDFEFPIKYLQNAAAIAAGNIMANPDVAAIIAEYYLATEEQILAM